MTYQVHVYGNGHTQMPTKTREYRTMRQAIRYQDSWVRRGVVAVAERKPA